MELHQLQGFFEVAREGSFTRAADKLYLTQPAISLQLKGLEEELGETLFERRRRNARLTPAGEILFRRAKAVFDELAAARAEIEGLRQVLRGRLVIGTSDTNCSYVLPPVLRCFRDSYPEVEIDIRNKMSSEVGRMVLGDEVDLGLATLPVRHRSLVNEVLFARRDVLICRPDHELAGKRSTTLKRVAAQPLLGLEQGSTTRKLMDEMFQRAGLDVEVAMNLGSIEVLKRFVEIGLGLALVPEVAVAAETAEGRLAAVPVAGLPARDIGLVEHKGRRRSPAAAAFVEMLQAQLSGKQL